MKRYWLLSLLVITMKVWSQTQADLPIVINYASGWGECEIDSTFTNVAENWNYTSPETVAPQGITLQYAIDRTNKASGTGSQRITINRSGAGSAQEVNITSTAIPITGGNYPQAGERIYVQYSLRTSALQNIKYEVMTPMTRVDGQTPPRALKQTDQPQTNWVTNTYSFAMPETTNQTMRVSLKMMVGEGAASGTFWLDNIRVYTGKTLPVRKAALKLALLFGDGGDWIQSVANYDLFVTSMANVTRFKAQKPSVKTYIYALGWETSTIRNEAGDFVGNSLIGNAGDFVPYTYANDNQSNWFLRDSNGRRIGINTSPSVRVWALNLGNQNFRNHIFTNMRNYFTNTCGPDSTMRPTGYYFDRLNNVLGYDTPTYPTRESRLAALLQYMEHFGTQMHQSGIYSIANAYAVPWNTDEFAPIQQNGWLDGYLMEGFLASVYGGAFRSQRDMGNQLRSAMMYRDRPVTLLGRMFNNDPSDQRFNLQLAGFYVVNHPNLYVLIAGEGSGGEPNIGESRVLPQTALPLGDPQTAEYEILAGSEFSGALFSRRYRYGIALLNTSQTVTHTYTPPRRYWDHLGRSFSGGVPVSIAPQTGLVLYAAPEIQIAISSDISVVQPGGNVTYTVQYSNTGRVSSGTFEIKVPLVEGMMNVIQKPSNATVQGGVLIMPIASVPAGGSGQFQFTVRVQ
jgi:hypothetical protein